MTESGSTTPRPEGAPEVPETPEVEPFADAEEEPTEPAEREIPADAYGEVIKARKEAVEEQIKAIWEYKKFRIGFTKEEGEWAFLNEPNSDKAFAAINAVVNDPAMEDEKKLKELKRYSEKLEGKLFELDKQDEHTEKTKEAYMKLLEARVKIEDTETDREERKRNSNAITNADVSRFLDGEIIVFTEPLFTLREKDSKGKHKKTNVLSWEWAQEGKYGPDFRYYLRAMLGKMVVLTGSTGEKRQVGSVLEKFLDYNKFGEHDEKTGNELVLYEGAGASEIQADVKYCLMQKLENMWDASGKDKSQALQGNSWVSQHVEKWADKTSAKMKDVMYDADVAANKLTAYRRDEISGDLVRVGAKKNAFSYWQLTETGMSRIDVMSKWIASVKDGQYENGPRSLEGKYLDMLTHTAHVFVALKDSRPSWLEKDFELPEDPEDPSWETRKAQLGEGKRRELEQYEAGLRMLRLGGEKEVQMVTDQFAAIFNGNNNNIDRSKVTRNCKNGDKLFYWIGRAGGKMNKQVEIAPGRYKEIENVDVISGLDGKDMPYGADTTEYKIWAQACAYVAGEEAKATAAATRLAA